ncbi:MAG TPA: dihydroneopterin triphosphate diphosphatase [Woeseiaceae bacterium]|nr:dihydroneopterin triphosphate diphosphatase [Woeseiaceae bacterium]
MPSAGDPATAAARRPESVLVVVYAADRNVLLLRRHRPFDFWQSVTGSLAPGESHADAAARELQEETGLSGEGELSFSGNRRAFVIDPRWRNRYAPGITVNVEYEWRFRLPEPRDVTLHETEHSAFEWLGLPEAVEKVWSWTNREALRELQEIL